MVFLGTFEVLDQPDRMCIGFGGQNGGGYKEYRSDRVRCLGKGLGVCLALHLLLACGRIFSYSFIAALFDLYLVSFGYCVVRRYFRHPDRKPDPSPLLLCESQNILLNFIMMLAFDYGLSILTTVEMLTSKPTTPPPVGVPEYDYRTLAMWQWWSGVVICISMLFLFAIEIILGWWLYKTLENEYDDLRYPLWLEEAIPPSSRHPGNRPGGEGNGAMFASGMGNGGNAAFYDNRNQDGESQNLIPPSDSDRLESQGSAFLGEGRTLGSSSGLPRDARHSRLLSDGL